MLSDRFGRKFYYLRLSITDACNFRCTYCLPDGLSVKPDSSKFLNLDEIDKLVAAFSQLGTQKVRITGGEPSLRKDLCAIIRAIKQHANIHTLALTTNGYKLPSQIQDWIDSGLDTLNVSIDSLEPRNFQQITGHDKLKLILQGIDLGLASSLKHIKINVVLMRQHNAHQLDEFLEWVRKKPLTIRFIELMQTGDNFDFFKANHISGQLILKYLQDNGWEKITRTLDAGPAVELSHPDFLGRVGLIMPYSKDFCKSCNRLRVSAQGKLHLCLFGEHGYDLRPWLQHESIEPLKSFIQESLMDKAVSHYLHEGKTGVMSNLSIIGG